MFSKDSITSKFKESKETAIVSLKLANLFWKTEPLLFNGTFLFYVIPAVLPFINLYIAKLVIDLVVQFSVSGNFNPASFYPLIALRTLTYFLGSASYNTQFFFNNLLRNKVGIYLTDIFYSKVSNLDIYYFDNDKFRDLLEKSRESVDFRIYNQINFLFYGLNSVIQLIISFIAIASLNWFFIILVLLVAIPSFIDEAYRAKVGWAVWDKNSPFRKRFGYLAHLSQSRWEIKEIKIFKLAQRFISEIKDIQQKFYQENKKISFQSFISGTAFDLLSTLVFIGIEVYVILQVIFRKLSVGDIGFYAGVVSNFQNSLAGSLSNLNRIYENTLYIKNYFELLSLEPKVKVPENGVKLDLKSAPKIEFKDVDFTYPEAKEKVLHNFSLTINPGEKIAFVGENGAGKSTIIKLLARFYDVDKGEILINGNNIKDLDLSDWYQYFGVLFQDFNHYDDPVKENIYFGDVEQKMDIKNIIKASTAAGAHQMINKLDNKYEQMLGKTFEKGTELSGGQWQKIALSRAFFRNAPVIVLDEPTAALDAKAEAEIFGRVEKLSKDKTVIIISHRFSTVRNADKIYVINNGKIVESGSHEKLMKEDGQYATLFKLQAKGYQ